MKKILIVSIVVVIVILVAVGYYFMPYYQLNIPDVTEDTVLFDYSSEPITNWNENAHEYRFHQKITSFNKQDLKNISIDIIFYKDGKQMGIESNDINEIENGAFDLDFTTKLDAEPDEFYYNVTDLNWA